MSLPGVRVDALRINKKAVRASPAQQVYGTVDAINKEKVGGDNLEIRGIPSVLDPRGSPDEDFGVIGSVTSAVPVSSGGAPAISMAESSASPTPAFADLVQNTNCSLIRSPLSTSTLQLVDV